jgi:hypothetical protein
MYNPGTFNAANAGKVFAVMEECINQCPRQMSWRGMDNKSGLLVDDEDVSVLVNNG